MFGGETMTTTDLLKSHDIKPSYTRVMIYDYLKENMTHPTVDEIYQSLLTTLPTLSKTTVYNTLDLFIEHHLVNVLIMEQQKHYDLATTPHAHFKCKSCGALIDIEVEPPKLKNEDNSYTIHHVELTYHGLCEKCLK